MTSQNPVDLVRHFFANLATGDVEGALADVDPAIAYTNVSLPTVHGMRRFAWVMRGLARPGLGFDVEFHAISADEEGVVLTERTDELRIGPLRLQFWVCGRHEVREGRIVVWRDYFDYFDMTKALVRGIVGLAFPGVLRRLDSVTVAA